MLKIILPAMIFLILLPPVLSGCIIHYEPKNCCLVLDRETTLTIYVELEHRKCDIPLEDTNYSAKGILILKKGQWIKVKTNLYKQEITVKAIKTGWTLRIWRDCEEKGISEACANCSGCKKKK